MATQFDVNGFLGIWGLWIVVILVLLGMMWAGKFLRGESRSLEYISRRRMARNLTSRAPEQDDLEENEKVRLAMEAHRACGCRVCQEILASSEAESQ